MIELLRRDRRGRYREVAQEVGFLGYEDYLAREI